MLGEDLPGEHLIASPGFADRMSAFIEVERSGGSAHFLVLVLVPIPIPILMLIHRVMLAGYDALAGFPLAGDDGRIGRQYEGRRRFFGPFDLGR